MSIVDEIKSIAKVVQQADNIDLYRQILEIQEKALEMMEDNWWLKRQIELLKEKLQKKESLFVEHHAYWVRQKDGSNDGPFCTRCWDADKILVRLKPCGDPDYSKCPNCKAGLLRLRIG